MGPQAAICRFTSGFTFQPQMRYPVLVQISGADHLTFEGGGGGGVEDLKKNPVSFGEKKKNCTGFG